jgi:thermostable 8-oxoguanine DNA glycosylase
MINKTLEERIAELKKWSKKTLEEAKLFAENNNAFPYEEAIVYCKGRREMAQEALEIINELQDTISSYEAEEYDRQQMAGE